jgi:hypothetical protein
MEVSHVQEAQRAAEKAFNVGTMDERVNKAVAAANKAATAARVVAVKAVQNQMHPSNNNDGTLIPSVCSWKTSHHQHMLPLQNAYWNIRFYRIESDRSSSSWGMLQKRFTAFAAIPPFFFAVNLPLSMAHMPGTCLEPHSVIGENGWLRSKRVPPLFLLQ